MLEATFWRQLLPRVTSLVNLERRDLSGCSTAVSWISKGGLGPPPLGDYLPPTSVLHRLSAELYSISHPALNTWGVLRRSMAAGGSEWPATLSEGLPEVSSSSGREDEGTSSEATTSARTGSRQSVVSKRWAVYSYVSRFTTIESLDRVRTRYQIPQDVVLRIPGPDERACSHVEDVALYESALTAGLRFPVQPFIRELLDFLSLAPGQVAPNGWRVILTCMVVWRECSDGQDDITVEEFLYCFEPSQIAASPGFWTFRNREESSKLVDGLPSSNRRWKDGYFFVCGDNWERLPEEGEDFVPFLRTWGVPSSSALTRPVLAPVWRDRVLRAQRLTNRPHTYYIQPELLFRHSFGPEPSAAVISLLETNKKRVATMKINKSKLKDMVEKGVPAVPINVKRKKPEDGSSSAPPAQGVRPSKKPILVEPPLPIPPSTPVVQIHDEEVPFVPLSDEGSTICRSLGLASKRAEAAITDLDFQEYGNARTEDVSKLMVHSLMRSLNEAMVISRRCLTVEDDLRRLKQRLAESEASEKNLKRAVFELTAEKRDLLATVDSVKVDLAAREGDAKAAIDARDAAQKELKHLMGQVEGARAAAVSDYKASEAFEENNLQCFFSGFEAFRKQANAKYPDLDFTGFQPYDDTDSVIEEGKKDDEDQTDDATS
uniref:Transposase (putative) gypsy type domain-containing protein n=1 Tax=Fagus sylvatica TaxID=28930 RepID=A0A2N9GMJ2_FAGSY